MDACIYLIIFLIFYQVISGEYVGELLKPLIMK